MERVGHTARRCACPRGVADCPGFGYQPESWLSSQRVFVVFLSPSVQILWQFLTYRHSKQRWMFHPSVTMVTDLVIAVPIFAALTGIQSFHVLSLRLSILSAPFRIAWFMFILYIANYAVHAIYTAYVDISCNLLISEGIVKQNMYYIN
jgi:hypothetical protein